MAMKRLSEAELLEKIVFSGLRNAFSADDLEEVAGKARLTSHQFAFDQHLISATVDVEHGGERRHYQNIELVYDSGRDDWIVFFDGESPDDACFDWDASAGVHKVQFF